MNIRFWIDPETGFPHVENQGVTTEEVIELLRNRGDDRPGGNNTRHALGQTDAGRYLRVIYVPDEDGGGLFVVTAYNLEGNQLRAYRRRIRR